MPFSMMKGFFHSKHKIQTRKYGIRIRAFCAIQTGLFGGGGGTQKSGMCRGACSSTSKLRQLSGLSSIPMDFRSRCNTWPQRNWKQCSACNTTSLPNVLHSHDMENPGYVMSLEPKMEFLGSPGQTKNGIKPCSDAFK